jgi:hypothetical protein
MEEYPTFPRVYTVYRSPIKFLYLKFFDDKQIGHIWTSPNRIKTSCIRFIFKTFMCELKIDERKVDFSVLLFVGKSYSKWYIHSAASEENFSRIHNIALLSFKENKQFRAENTKPFFKLRIFLVPQICQQSVIIVVVFYFPEKRIIKYRFCLH